MKTELIHIRLEPDLKKKLQEEADKDHRNLGDYIRVQLMKAIKYTPKKKS
jgi:predicted transcriptional regulator